MSVKWSLGGGDYVDSILTSGKILKLILTVVGGKFPIIVVMIPQECGIGACVSLSKNWPGRPRHWDKTFHWRHRRLLIFLELWSFWVNELHMRNSMEGTCWSEFERLTTEDLTCATTLSWSSYCCHQGWVTTVYPVKWQRISRLHLSPSTLLGGPGDRLECPEKVHTKISLGFGWEEQPP